RHLTVRAEAHVKEQLSPKRRRGPLVGHGVGWTGRQVSKGSKRQGADTLPLFFRPVRGLAATREGACSSEEYRHCQAADRAAAPDGQRARLEVAVSLPAAASMPTSSTHHPGMLKRMPPTMCRPSGSLPVTRGMVGRPCPCWGIPPSIATSASTGAPPASDT